MSEREELRVLAHRMADATASTADASRLSELLRSRPDLHDEYLGFLDTHAALCWEFRGNQADHLDARQATESPAASCRDTRVLRPGRWPKRIGWFAAVAGLLAAALLIGRWQGSALASPTWLVRAAIETHREPVERVYLVQIEPKEPPEPGFNPPRDVRIATQGDRFWVEVNPRARRWVWGRDADGAIWITLGPQRAMRIEPDEIGPSLQSLSNVFSLELESLLNNVLKHCRLKRSTSSEATHVITATPGLRWRKRVQVREMTIEFDKETRAIRRLVVHREVPQQGQVTTTFTLVEARAADESLYRAEGHLTEPYEIMTRDSPVDQRREILAIALGLEGEGWIKPPSE